MKKIAVILLLIITSSLAYGQNTAITDEASYTAETSAMLDVYSQSKGLLVPRMTSAQMNAISSAARTTPLPGPMPMDGVTMRLL